MTETGRTVAVLGGGIAGLSAAHHLVERGYRVTVFDQRGFAPDDLGGKARSYDDDSGADRMYGEHGFRFFPGFYRHVVATMAEIPTGDHRPEDGNVADHLAPLDQAAFYARQAPGGPTPGRAGPLTRACDLLARLVNRMVVVVVLGWVLAACVLGDQGAPAEWWWAWAAVPIVTVLGETVLMALTAGDDRHLVVELPSGERSGRSRLQGMVLRLHPWARWLVVPAVVAAWVRWDLPGSWPAAAVVVAAAWFFPMLATVGEMWALVGRIPLSVRPGLLESAWACFRVGALVTSSPQRLHEQWEHESWWSFIGAYRFSRAFRLAFATGLTRSFVATPAEAMSARTGASILAQLLYDTSSSLTSRTTAADRVLDGPTHETWIRPWVAHLRRRGVRFNELGDDADDGPTACRHVDVTRLLAADDGPGGSLVVDGFDYLDRSCEQLAPVRAPRAFDHYVLAVAGTAAQRILANSPDLVRRDRAVAPAGRPVDPLGDLRTGGSVPALHGILDLEFGWMSGIVYHLPDPVTLPHGHLLCLESEWALTAIDQSRVWAGRGRTTGPWKTVLSVNISDWTSSSPRALPARLEDIDAVADEAWCQLREHVPDLAAVVDTPPYVTDTAINDPTALAVAKGLPLPPTAPTLPTPPTAPTTSVRPEAYQNLALTNDEKLLINVAGSWDDRPTARTAFANLVIAGDYVRTSTDFASMEAADEAARRAVNVILERDGAGPDVPRCEVADELEVPAELRLPTRAMRALDRAATWLHLPHPLTLFAAPCGWLAGAEVSLRHAVRRLRHPGRRR